MAVLTLSIAEILVGVVLALGALGVEGPCAGITGRMAVLALLTALVKHF